MDESSLSLQDRAAQFRALGEPRRLQIVDALQHSDRSVGALAELTGLPTNLVAFHLQVLEDAGVILRSVSQGDARRRYVTLNPHVLALLGDPPSLGTPPERVLFLCTANSARSQLAAHLWQQRTGAPALSAGTQPAEQVHPTAATVAQRHGLDLSHARPTAYQRLTARPQLLVSVCDRAHEAAPELDLPRLHWSIPDPVGHDEAAFEDAYQQLSLRIDRLALATEAA